MSHDTHLQFSILQIKSFSNAAKKERDFISWVGPLDSQACHIVRPLVLILRQPRKLQVTTTIFSVDIRNQMKKTNYWCEYSSLMKLLNSSRLISKVNQYIFIMGTNQSLSSIGKTQQHLRNSSCGICKHCRGAAINGHKTLVGTDIIICEPCEAESKKQVITSTSLLQI